jgi:prephenate dehydrogenase
MTDAPTPGNPPRTVGLIGGTGRMGAMFQRLFEADGCAVRVAGPSEDPGYGGLVAEADVVIVTVPIAETLGVIRRIAPLLRPEQLLSDFTSIKAEPVAAMLEAPACVIGCHPLFAPMVSPVGQNVVLCPQRPGPWLAWYEAFFRRHGMKVVQMAPQEHDEAMAFIQGLTHFINIVFARTLQTRQAHLERILQVCSPVYQVLFAILCRILSGEAKLYGQIQGANPANPPVLEDFLANGRAFLDVVEQRDWPQVYRFFDEAAAYLGDYKQVAREESDFLIERMTEYLQQRHAPGEEET